MVSMFPTDQFTLKRSDPDAAVIFCTGDEYLEKLRRLGSTWLAASPQYSCPFKKLEIITVVFIDFYSKEAILTEVYL